MAKTELPTLGDLAKSTQTSIATAQTVRAITRQLGAGLNPIDALIGFANGLHDLATTTPSQPIEDALLGFTQGLYDLSCYFNDFDQDPLETDERTHPQRLFELLTSILEVASELAGRFERFGVPYDFDGKADPSLSALNFAWRQYAPEILDRLRPLDWHPATSRAAGSDGETR